MEREFSLKQTLLSTPSATCFPPALLLNMNESGASLLEFWNDNHGYGTRKREEISHHRSFIEFDTSSFTRHLPR
ncbi:hypothetical protein MHYP_G00359890 [Metynnis hypsauchen]